MDNNTALVEKAKGELVEKEDYKGIRDIAKAFIESGYFTSVRTQAQAVVKILAGRELGIGPYNAVNNLYIVPGTGKISMEGTLMVDMVRGSGRYDYEILEQSDEKCSIQFFKLWQGKWQKSGIPVEYTYKDATIAGLTGKDNWKKHRKQMLFWRAFSIGARQYCSDAIHGAYTHDELLEAGLMAPTAKEATSQASSALDEKIAAAKNGVVTDTTPPPDKPSSAVKERTAEKEPLPPAKPDKPAKKKKLTAKEKKAIKAAAKLAKKTAKTEVSDSKDTPKAITSGHLDELLAKGPEVGGEVLDVLIIQSGMDVQVAFQDYTDAQAVDLLELIKKQKPAESEAPAEPEEPKKKNPNQCEEPGCTKYVSKNVKAYSQEKFGGKVYCYDCQKKHK